MKKIIFFGLLVVICYSCVEVESYHSPFRSQAQLYKEASELRGLNEFIINETTTDKLKSINKKISLDSRYFPLSSDGFKLNNDNSECPNIKIYKINEFFIEDLRISNLELTFYQDTLFKIILSESEVVKDAFNKKYGEGIRNYNFSLASRNKKNEKMDVTENIIWENESVRAEYNNNLHTKMSRVLSSYRSFEIISKTSIVRRALDCMNKVNSERKAAEAQQKQKIIDQI